MTYTVLPTGVMRTIRAALDTEKTLREREFDFMSVKAKEKPTDVFIANQLTISARRLAEVRVAIEEAAAMIPGAPIPF